MCDSHFQTLGGEREDLDVNISYSQQSTPLLLYSTPTAVCVCLCVCVCVSVYLWTCLFLFPSSLLFLWVSSQADHRPQPPHLFTNWFKHIQYLFSSTQILMLLTLYSTASPLLVISVLFICCHPSPITFSFFFFLFFFFLMLPVSVQTSLSGVWCNIIFCLSLCLAPSASLLLLRRGGLPRHVHAAWRMSLGWEGVNPYPPIPPPLFNSYILYILFLFLSHFPPMFFVHFSSTPTRRL